MTLNFDPNDYGNRKELRRAWIEFLAQWYWTLIVTLTFYEPVHPWVADKKFRVWIAKLNREAYGRRYYNHSKAIQWFRAVEWQHRDVLHYHVLLSRLEGITRDFCATAWRTLRGGFVTIELPRRQVAVRRYVTKLVQFGGEPEIGGTWDEQLVLKRTD